MDQSARASFIPKAPLGAVQHGGGGVASLALLLSLLLFIPSLVAGGAVLAYQQFLNNAIAQKSASLSAAEAAFDPSTIQDLERLDTRINAAQQLLTKHVAPDALFDFLASQTLSSVQFNSFGYSLNDDGTASLTLSGEGSSFASVALQSDQFGANKLLKDVVFSNIAVGTGGAVTFSVKATVDASLLSYENSLSPGGSATTAVPTSAPITATATTSPSGQPPIQP